MVGFHRRPRVRLQALIAMAAAVAAVPAFAQPIEQGSGRIPGLPEPSIGTSLPRALADPGGVRSALAKRGILFAVNYIGEVLGNPTGGYAQGTLYDGRLELELQADFGCCP